MTPLVLSSSTTYFTFLNWDEFSLGVWGEFWDSTGDNGTCLQGGRPWPKELTPSESHCPHPWEPALPEECLALWPPSGTFTKHQKEKAAPGGIQDSGTNTPHSPSPIASSSTAILARPSRWGLSTFAPAFFPARTASLPPGCLIIHICSAYVMIQWGLSSKYSHFLFVTSHAVGRCPQSVGQKLRFDWGHIACGLGWVQIQVFGSWLLHWFGECLCASVYSSGKQG